MTVNHVITRMKFTTASGVKPTTIDTITSRGAVVVVVGGAACNTKDRAATVKGMRRHLKREEAGNER